MRKKLLFSFVAWVLFSAFAYSAGRDLLRSFQVTEQEWKEAISSSLADPLTPYKNNLKSCERTMVAFNFQNGVENELTMIHDFDSKTKLSQITAIQKQGKDEIKVEYTYFPIEEEDKFLSGYIRYFKNGIVTGGEWFCTSKTEQRKPEVSYRSRFNDHFMHYNSYGNAKWINIDMDGSPASGYVITNETNASGMRYSDFFMFVFDEQKRLGKFISEIKAMSDYTRTAITYEYKTPDISFPVSSLSIQLAASSSFFGNDEFRRKFVTYFMNKAKRT